MLEAQFPVPYLVSGILALITAFLIYLPRSKQQILMIKATNDIFWVFNFILLGPAGLAGAIQNTVGFCRETVFLFKEKGQKWASHKIWLYVFIILFAVGVPLLSWNKSGFYSLMPATGSVLSALSLYAKKTKHVKILAIPAQSLCLAYSICIFNLFGIISYSFMVLSAIIGLIKLFVDENVAKKSAKDQDDQSNLN